MTLKLFHVKKADLMALNNIGRPCNKLVGKKRTFLVWRFHNG